MPSAPENTRYVTIKTRLCQKDKRCKNFELPFLQSTQVTMDYAKQKAILMAQLKMSSGVKPARKNQVNRRMTNVHIS